jgi:cob(I)alamin adenosyltransferase
MLRGSTRTRNAWFSISSSAAPAVTVILAPVKIYTRRGDRGETDLLGGPRVAKDHLRVEAYGAVDELNAALGAALAATAHEDVRDLGRAIQEALFDLGAHLSCPEVQRGKNAAVREPSDEEVEVLEARIDAFERELESLRNFVLPGGTPAAAAFHVARTVCRRAERRAVSLEREAPLQGAAVRYLNRLSDLLFVLARVENRRAGLADLIWAGRKR